MSELNTDILLDVNDLRVWLNTPGGPAEILRGVSFDIRVGECVALVGESGSGKSVTARSILGLHDPINTHMEGTATLRGYDGDVLRARGAELRQIRGSKLAMVFQDPMTSLDPVARVREQLADTIRLRERGASRSEVRERSVAVLRDVGIDDPDRILASWPHQLSGGLRQRVTIALAIVAAPELLVADEPTTALDVTVQAQVLRVLTQLSHEHDMGLLIVTHDMDVVRAVADRVAVMRKGRIVEFGPTAEILNNPSHPYTRGLVASTVTMTTPRHEPLSTVQTFMEQNELFEEETA